MYQKVFGSQTIVLGFRSDRISNRCKVIAGNGLATKGASSLVLSSHCNKTATCMSRECSVHQSPCRRLDTKYQIRSFSNQPIRRHECWTMFLKDLKFVRNGNVLGDVWLNLKIIMLESINNLVRFINKFFLRTNCPRLRVQDPIHQKHHGKFKSALLKLRDSFYWFLRGTAVHILDGRCTLHM